MLLFYSSLLVILLVKIFNFFQKKNIKLSFPYYDDDEVIYYSGKLHHVTL